MIKIALIISALNEATQTVATDQWGIDHRVCCGTEIGYPHEPDCLWMYALTHAHELKDAETKTQQWGNPKYLIEEAVLTEREACAMLCEEWYLSGAVANAIRARGEK